MASRRGRGDDAARRWRVAVAGLRTWQRGGERAPHKPLLTLMLIARAERGEGARVSFDAIAEPLAALLREFGPPRKSYHPEYPFWHLRKDGFWIAEGADRLPLRKAGHSPSRRTLLEAHAAGLVRQDMWETLTRDPALRRELVAAILDDYWPESYHEPIRRAIGLPEPGVSRRSDSRAVRDPSFREHVLRAYERRCAVCGYDGRLGRDDLALEAAHIRWHCYDGPDQLENGLALCTFHHAALDRGALGLTENRRILVSADVHGTAMVETLLLRHAGAELRSPQSGMPGPAAAHVRWHARQVFRAPARFAS